MMTGAFLRVKRYGKWEAVEVEYLTDDERAMIFKDKEPEEIIRWLDMTCSKLRENEQILDELRA